MTFVYALQTYARHETGLKLDLRETKLQRSQKTKNNVDEENMNKNKHQKETKKIRILLMILKAIACVFLNAFEITNDWDHWAREQVLIRNSKIM